MSFYDDASLIFDAGAAAGKDGKAYNVKPIPEYGSELVTNGGFDTDSDWNKGTGWSISGGTANCDGSFGGILRQNNAVPLNTKLYVSLEVTNYVSGALQVKFAPVTYDLNVTKNGIYTLVTDGDNSLNGDIQLVSQGFIGSVDNISIREVISPAGDFTFTRGTNLTATRVGKDGYIEKGRENLLLQSNQFDTTWINFNTTETSGQSGYDGTDNAWKLSTTGVNGYDSIYQVISFTGVYTISVYAKAGSNEYLTIRSLGDIIGVEFKLDDGDYTTVTGSPINAFMEDAGSGWWRCGFTANFTSATIVEFLPQELGISTAGNIYIQDAQLELGLAATDYIETGATTATAGLLEDEPRFDYSGGGCPALLMEPQRRNYVVNSEHFGASEWAVSTATKNSTFTYMPDEVTPAGSKGVWKYTADTSGDQLGTVPSGTLSIGDTVTNSIYVKRAGGQSTITIDFRDINNVVASTYTLTDADGWKRITATGTCDGTPSIARRHYLNLGTANDAILVWGAQQEDGPYVTSYIPTYGSSATRAKEGASDSYDQIATLDLSSSGLDGEDVSWFFEFRNNQDIIRDGSDPNVRVSEDLTNIGAFRIYRGVTSTTQLKVVLTANSGTSPTAYTITSDNPKVLIKRTWSTGRIQVYVDGVPVRDEINLNFDRWYKLDLAGHGSVTELKQILAFPTVLSNNDSEILTGTSYSSFAAMATSTALNYTIYE